MSGLSTKARVAVGLVGLAVSVLLVAAMLDLVPDRVGAVREGRTALAEVLASASSGWLQSEDLERAEETLRLAVERSPDMLSAAMRRRDGQLVLRVGEHEAHWRPMLGSHSTDAQLRVPLLAGNLKWGELELRFRPLLGEGTAALLGHPLIVLTAFVALACFFAFYVYLSKALTQLDPSKAVPGRVRSALDTMAEGLLVIDRGGRVVLANRAFAAMVGGDAGRLVGTQPADLAFECVDGGGDAAARFPWIRALETGSEEYGVPMRLRDVGGSLRALMVNCSPVMGASGRPGGVLVSFDDVTELEARGTELREAKDEADQANRAKSEFLANMSHEIRTPMNAILGFTEVLRRGYQKSDQESRAYLNTIHSSGTHLLELINDILDLSKVEAGHLEVERVECAAHRVIQEVVKVLGVKAREKGVALDFEAEGPLPATVLGDPARLRQIVTNLVGNAIKFTERGNVRVRARLDRLDGEPALEIRVSDSGIGIAADKLDTVFEAFAQADSSVTRRFGGTGLGLPISRRFARALGGDITLESVAGEGSTFTVRLPTGALDGVAMLSPAEIAAAHDEAKEMGARTWRFAPARVLVADDAAENRALLGVVLDGCGLELTDAADGQEALDRAAEGAFDLVLMDMQMPVMDGYTATRRLRERGFAAPVIALTAHAMKGYEQECRAAGCDDFVTKPVDIDRLMETLAKWLPEKARAVEATAPPDANVSPAPRGASISPAPDGAPVTSPLAADPRMHHVLRLFATRLETETGRMRACCEQGDLDTLAELGHWLKGSAGTVGYGPFTEPARAMEEQARRGDAKGAATSLAVIEALAGALVLPGDGPGAGAPSEPTASVAEAGPGGAAPGAAAPGGAAQDAAADAAGTTARVHEPHRPAVPDAGRAGLPPSARGDTVTSPLAANPRMHAVLRLFGERLQARLADLGDEADLETLGNVGHWLRGSAGSVGYGDFTGPATRLEERARAGDAEGAGQALASLRDLAARLELPPEAAAEAR